MKRVLISMLAATLLAGPAIAGDVFTFQTTEEFQEDLEENLGERELEYLTEEIREDIERELGKVGLSPARIDVTIKKAKPNRPTFTQLSNTPGLSYESFSIGGMELSATAYGADGQVLGTLDYGWFESDIRWAQRRSVWSDARRASGKFARKFAKELAR